MPEEKRTIDRLLFVFAANSGILNAAVDSARKVLMLQGCALCSITHGLTGETREWKDCREQIGVPVEYVHLDEMSTELHEIVGESVPSVVASAGDEYFVLLEPEVLDRCKGSVADFKGRLRLHAAMRDLHLPLTTESQ